MASISYGFAKAPTKVTTTFVRREYKETDVIEFTNRIICPKCRKSMFRKTMNAIPHEDVMDVDRFESLNRQILLLDAPFKCGCGAKIELEAPTQEDKYLDNAIFAYIDNTNDLMEFLERAARYE